MPAYLVNKAPKSTGAHTWLLRCETNFYPRKYGVLTLYLKPVIRGDWMKTQEMVGSFGLGITTFSVTLKNDRIARHFKFNFKGAGLDLWTEPQLAFPPSELATGPGGPFMITDCTWYDAGGTCRITCTTDVFCVLQCASLARWPSYVLTTEIKRGIQVPGCPQLSYPYRYVANQIESEGSLWHRFDIDHCFLSPEKLVYFRGSECDRPSPSLSPPIAPRHECGGI